MLCNQNYKILLYTLIYVCDLVLVGYLLSITTFSVKENKYLTFFVSYKRSRA